MKAPIPILLALLAASVGTVGSAHGSEVGSLEMEMEQLREEGRYTAAAVVAERRLQTIEGDPAIEPWRIRDAQVTLKSLRRIAALPRELRSQLSRADSLQAVINECADTNDLVRGLDVARQQYEIRQEILGDRHPQVATSLGELIYFNYCLGETENMLTLMDEQQRLNQDLYGRNHPTVALDLSNSGLVLSENDRFLEAEVKLQRAISIFKQLFPGDKFWQVPDIYIALNNLALNYCSKGDYSTGIPLLEQVLAKEIEFKGHDHPDVLIRMDNLGALLGQIGELGGAKELKTEAIEIRRELFGDHDVGLGVALNNFSVSLVSENRFAEAEAVIQEALTIFRNNYPGDHLDIALALSNLGGVYFKTGDPERALPAVQESLAMFERVVDPRHQRIAFGNARLGLVLLQLDRQEEAARCLDKSALLYREIHPRGHPDLIDGLVYQARLRTELDDFATAETLLLEATAQYERVRLRMGQGLARASFLDSPYVNLALVKLHLGDNPGAWQAAEMGVGRVIIDQLTASGQGSAPGSSPDVPERGTAVGPVSELSEIQALLPPRTAMVGLIDGASLRSRVDPLNRIWAYIIKGSGEVTWVPLVEATQFEGSIQAVSDFKDAVSSPPDPFTDGERFASGAGRLHGTLFHPLQSALTGIENLVVIPSGIMFGLSLAALRSDDDRWLGELYKISYCPSATVYAWLRQRSGATGSPLIDSAALFLADPPFTAIQAEDMEREAASGDLGAISPPPLQAVGDGQRGESPGDLPRLRGSRREILAARKHITGGGTTTLLGEDASEQKLRGLIGRMGDFNIVHLATHALINRKHPERCALILSQVDLPDPVETIEELGCVIDGRWTAEEILQNWRLDADLVVLSGCGTALGRKVMGEGQVGFAQTILQAGARNLILSLWEVDDAATSMLFERFYYHLTTTGSDHPAGVTIPGALQRAQQDLRDHETANGDHPFRHPWYWAGFIHIGGSH